MTGTPDVAEQEGYPAPDSGATNHWIVLVICLATLGVALLLSPVSPGLEQRLSIWGVPTPELCAMKRTTNLRCPGCGLTRSWVALAHGHFAWSLEHNPTGPLLFAYAFAQAVRHALWLMVVGWRRQIERFGRWLDQGMIILALLLLVMWLPRFWGDLDALRAAAPPTVAPP